MKITSFFRRYAKRFVAIAVIVGLFCLTRLPAVSASERSAIASRFHFTRMPLAELPGTPNRRVRSVHPELKRHDHWISAVGASVALNDLDGDGLANDVCYVDTRSDRIIVAPVPGTENRYQPFELGENTFNPDIMAPMGCLPSDLNEDGQMDILVYYWGRTPVAFLKQDSPPKNSFGSPPQQINIYSLSSPQIWGVRGAKGGLGGLPGQTNSLQVNSYLTQEIYPETEKWYTNAATFADLDGDGHNDLIIGNYFPDGAEILNPNATTKESMQHSMTRAFNGGKNRILLWHNATAGISPTVQFQEAKDILEPDMANAWTLAVGTADLDGDLLPEIYFANDFGPDRLLHNRSHSGELEFALLKGQKGLTTPNSKVLGNDSFKGMGVDFADINHDGLFDIYVSNIAAEYALEESHFLFTSTGKVHQMQKGIAPYVDRSEPLGLSRSGWGWETKFGDFDNDGELEALQATGFAKGEINRWPELQELALGNDELLSHPNSWFQFHENDDLSGDQNNPFFVRSSNGRYYDFAKELGLDDPFVTRGIATADVDGDGDLDFAIANQWDSSYFYRNDSPNPGNFLELHLIQHPQNVHNNRSPVNSKLGVPAIGATATVHLPNGEKLVAQVDGGNGHSGARSSDLHFGLGEVSGNTQLPVEVSWRDNVGQTHQETLQLSPGLHTILLGSQVIN